MPFICKWHLLKLLKNKKKKISIASQCPSDKGKAPWPSIWGPLQSGPRPRLSPAFSAPACAYRGFPAVHLPLRWGQNGYWVCLTSLGHFLASQRAKSQLTKELSGSVSTTVRSHGGVTPLEEAPLRTGHILLVPARTQCLTKCLEHGRVRECLALSRILDCLDLEKCPAHQDYVRSKEGSSKLTD